MKKQQNNDGKKSRTSDVPTEQTQGANQTRERKKQTKNHMQRSIFLNIFHFFLLPFIFFIIDLYPYQICHEIIKSNKYSWTEGGEGRVGGGSSSSLFNYYCLAIYLPVQISITILNCSMCTMYSYLNKKYVHS